ncbi:hypothetical protein UT300003_33350 [Clostridium sardiniense]|uniref:hypothetical protein n=1 Tax=Clostridium sardiniense TaxID=29369 RepID=UPI0019576F3A|nr:hypothetical protein [Clostridium sardiniense]MBM7836277.1 hypothetical protein [Clostridium sardiniense]
MKKLKMILSWIALSLILQCGVLFFLDKFYFKDNTDVNMEQVAINNNHTNTNMHVQIPTNAKDIKVSYDGRYISYYENYSLEVCDTTSGDIKPLKDSDGREILRSVWLQDRNMLLTLEVEDNQIVLYNYEPQKGVNQKIVDICPYNASYKNFDIQASTITGVTYVRVNNAIYRVDINQNFATNVPLTVRSLGSVSIMPTKDRLVYISKNGTIVHMTQPNERVPMNSKEPIEILGIDEDGYMYLGEVKDNLVNGIIKKSLENIDAKSEKIALDKSVDKKDIFINGKGDIYVNYSNKGIVKNIKSSKETKYKGKFISYYNDGVSSILDGKYYKTTFSK